MVVPFLPVLHIGTQSTCPFCTKEWHNVQCFTLNTKKSYIHTRTYILNAFEEFELEGNQGVYMC